MVLRRLSEHSAAARIFQCGQALARLKAQIGDDSKSGAFVQELRNIMIELPETANLRRLLNDVISIAEAARNDPARRVDLEVLIGSVRSRM
jgi:hypothetical protein